MKIKKFAAIVMGVAMAMSLAACSGAAVATVNGVPIRESELDFHLNSQLASSGMTQDDVVESMGQDYLNQFKTDALDSLIYQELLMQYAAGNGLDQLTDEERQEVDGAVANFEDTIRLGLEQNAQSKGEIIEAAALVESESYLEYLKSSGLSEGLIEDQYSRQAILSKAFNQIMEGYSPTEEDAVAYYGEMLAEQEAVAAADPDYAADNYLYEGYDVNVYVPEGLIGKAKYVKHILLEVPTEIQEQVDAIHAEEEHDHDEEERMLADAMTELKAQAEDIIAKLEAGEDFEGLIEEYGQDPGMEYYPNGYLVFEGSNFVEEFVNASMALENVGDHTKEPVESTYGYHIIKYVADPQPGAVPYEDVSVEVWEALENTKRAEFWQQELTKLEENADIQRTEFIQVEE